MRKSKTRFGERVSFLTGPRYTGSIVGELTDSSGAKIVGATITVTDTTTNFQTKAVMNKDGSYQFSSLRRTPTTLPSKRRDFRWRAALASF